MFDKNLRSERSKIGVGNKYVQYIVNHNIKKRQGNGYGNLGFMETHLKNSTEPLKKVQSVILQKKQISKWIHRFATDVCVAVFHAGLSYTTVLTAYTFNASAKC